MKETELTQLCKSIYRKHRDAIDLIVEHGKKGTGQQAVEDLLEKDGSYEILYSTSSSVWFIPKSWAKWLPENAVVWPNLKRRVSICCWIEFLQDRMHLHFELCKMDDSKLRLKCAKQLKKANFKLGAKAFNETATYSRFFNVVRKVKDHTNFDETRDIAEKLLTKAEEQYPIAEAVFKNVFTK